jgi:hypothetical protein
MEDRVAPALQTEATSASCLPWRSRSRRRRQRRQSDKTPSPGLSIAFPFVNHQVAGSVTSVLHRVTGSSSSSIQALLIDGSGRTTDIDPD